MFRAIIQWYRSVTRYDSVHYVELVKANRALARNARRIKVLRQALLDAGLDIKDANSLRVVAEKMAEHYRAENAAIFNDVAQFGIELKYRDDGEYAGASRKVLATEGQDVPMQF